MMLRPLFPLLAVCALQAGSAAEHPLSSPSRAALLQREAGAHAASQPADAEPSDDPMAGIRRSLFKLTCPIIVLPPETPELAAISVPTIQPREASAPAISRDDPKPEVLPHPLSPTREVSVTNPVSVPAAKTSGDDALAVRELALQPAGFTPYDRYLSPVRSVIANVPDRGNSITAACSFMREAHAFRYVMRDPYRADPPAVTAARHAGDCKSKALWLFDQLGDPAALYVIGKVEKGAKASHAWVYWRYDARWWILDPTNRSAPIAADSLARDHYVPYYSFGKDGSFRHPATQLLLAQNIPATPTPAVASHPTKRKTRR
jgi:hypothetical protein